MNSPTPGIDAVLQPEISVCLAAYNGDRFIREQIASILSQLGPCDELIVCDDGSTDSTLSVVKSFSDPRIRLLVNESNLGHVRNFEKLLTLARGRYVFLSDQDDIWLDGKVRRALNAFRENDDVCLVYHNLVPVDEHGEILQCRFPFYREGARNSILFLLRQLLQPQLFGCACAIRGSKMANLLPFPACVYAHDHWLAVWGAVNGRVYVSSEVLVHYRRHGANLTPRTSRPLLRALHYRFKVLQQLGISLYRRCLHGSEQ